MSRSELSYVGCHFGDLFVVQDAKGHLMAPFYDCRCICGKRVLIQREWLHLKIKKKAAQKTGDKKYKYVCRHARLPKVHTKTGATNRSSPLNPTYRSWEAARRRVYSKTAKDYNNYGGRGITMCKEWDNFENFLHDMGERPEGTSLGRIDNDGPYSPDNCRWETREQQQNNTRANVVKEGYTIKNLASITGLTYNAVELRLRRGASVKDILETPKNHPMKKFLIPIAEEIGQRNEKLVITGVRREDKDIIYTCRCDCGNMKEVTRRNFKKTKSCGCMRSVVAKNKKVAKPSSISQEYSSLPLFYSTSVGKKYSKLTIMEVRRKTSKPGVYVQYAKCKCDCGNETIVATGNLTGNPQHTTSCGCAKVGAQGPKVDIIKEGDRFGKLLVLKARIEHSAYIATCKCDCGNPDDVKVAGAHLKYGRVVSCGCDGKNENVKVELRENKKK